jgi:hypothetical protein
MNDDLYVLTVFQKLKFLLNFSLMLQICRIPLSLICTMELWIIRKMVYRVSAGTVVIHIHTDIYCTSIFSPVETWCLRKIIAVTLRLTAIYGVTLWILQSAGRNVHNHLKVIFCSHLDVFLLVLILNDMQRKPYNRNPWNIFIKIITILQTEGT